MRTLARSGAPGIDFAQPRHDWTLAQLRNAKTGGSPEDCRQIPARQALLSEAV
jgi:hypothetical protein